MPSLPRQVRTKLIKPADIPKAAQTAACVGDRRNLPSRVLPIINGVKFGSEPDAFNWKNIDHVKRLILLFDAFHDFGDKKRAGGSLIPGDVYLRKTFKNFPGCPGEWTAFQIMVGFGVTAPSDIEGSLQDILIQNCPDLCSSENGIVLKNTPNVFYQRVEDLPEGNMFPTQFDVLVNPNIIETVMRRILGDVDFNTAKSAGTLFYSDARPEMHEKFGEEAGTKTQATVFDSATVNDIMTGVKKYGNHTFKQLNLEFQRHNVKIELTEATPAEGRLPNDPPFKYVVELTEKTAAAAAAAGAPPPPIEKFTLDVESNKLYGPSLNSLSRIVIDSELKRLLKTNPVAWNGKDRTYWAKNYQIKSNAIDLSSVFRFMSSKGMKDADLDSYAFNVKSSADLEQAEQSNAIVGASVDGGAATLMFITGHISVYRHVRKGAGKEVYTICLRQPRIGGGVEESVEQIALKIAKRNYLTAVNTLNFYVDCCNRFNEFIITESPEINRVLTGILQKFTESLSSRNEVVRSMLTYISKKYNDQLIQIVQEISIKIGIVKAPTLARIDTTRIPEDEGELTRLTTNIYASLKNDPQTAAVGGAGMADEDLPDNFRETFLARTRILDEMDLQPGEKLKGFLERVKTLFGSPSTDRIVDELEALTDSRADTAKVDPLLKTLLDTERVVTVFKGAPQKLFLEVQLAFNDIRTAVKTASRANAGAGGIIPGPPLGVRILNDLRSRVNALLSGPITVEGGARRRHHKRQVGGATEYGDAEKNFERLYAVYNEADDYISTAYAALPGLDNAQQQLTVVDDGDGETIALPMQGVVAARAENVMEDLEDIGTIYDAYNAALERAEDSLEKIFNYMTKLELERATISYSTDIDYIPKFMKTIIKLYTEITPKPGTMLTDVSPISSASEGEDILYTPPRGRKLEFYDDSNVSTTEVGNITSEYVEESPPGVRGREPPDNSTTPASPLATSPAPKKGARIGTPGTPSTVAGSIFRRFADAATRAFNGTTQYLGIIPLSQPPPSPPPPDAGLGAKAVGVSTNLKLFGSSGSPSIFDPPRGVYGGARARARRQQSTMRTLKKRRQRSSPQVTCEIVRYRPEKK